VLHQVGREQDRALQVARPNPELGVDDGRVEDEDAPRAAAGARSIEELDLGRALSDEARRVLARVADGGRRAQERGLLAVKTRHPDEARDDVRHVRAEHAPVGVQLVEHHELEPLEQTRPLRMVREDRGTQHVGVGHHD
jgi:hypothetical protein